MTHMDPLPHFQNYWVQSPNWLAGIHPRKYLNLGPHILQTLPRMGFNTYIDVSAGERSAYTDQLQSGMEYHAFPIASVGTPEHPAHMQRILDCIDDALARRRKLYLHCRSGRGRTGTVIGCWLARHGQGGETALQTLRELWAPSQAAQTGDTIPETREQTQYILNWRE
jgi:protein-tyrosine phosphatase